MVGGCGCSREYTGCRDAKAGGITALRILPAPMSALMREAGSQTGTRTGAGEMSTWPAVSLASVLGCHDCKCKGRESAVIGDSPAPPKGVINREVWLGD